MLLLEVSFFSFLEVLPTTVDIELHEAWWALGDLASLIRRSSGSHVLGFLTKCQGIPKEKCSAELFRKGQATKLKTTKQEEETLDKNGLWTWFYDVFLRKVVVFDVLR